MRKLPLLVMLVVVALSGIAGMRSSVAHAQGGALPLNEWVEGTLTTDSFEVTYTVSLSAGDIVLIEMYPALGTYDADPALELSDSAGNLLAEDDDTVGLGAVIVYEIAAAGDYTVLATRALGVDGSSTGDYILRASQVTPLTPGSSVETTIYADDTLNYPSLSVLKPETDVTWAFNLTQVPGSDLNANFVLEGGEDEYGFTTTLFDLDNTAGLTSATLNINLTGGQIYLLLIQEAPFSFAIETTEVPVTVTIGEAAQ